MVSNKTKLRQIYLAKLFQLSVQELDVSQKEVVQKIIWFLIKQKVQAFCIYFASD
jgi:hypothetical protein